MFRRACVNDVKLFFFPFKIELVARLVSADDIKSHPYFDDVEWDNILRQKAQFIPELSNEDVSNRS